ncbi:5923_t:CDS:2, partial [Scutellospora calospora]
IILDNQLFTTIENKYFQQIIKLLNSNTTILVGDTIRNNIIKSFEDESININCLLQSVLEKLSFAIDLQSILLDFINLHSSYSEENLCNAFVSSYCEFGILPKIFIITNDDVTNNDIFIQQLENICYNENIAFNTIKSHFKIRSSLQHYEQFMRQVKAASLENCNLILDIKTR